MVNVLSKNQVYKTVKYLKCVVRSVLRKKTFFIERSAPIDPKSIGTPQQADTIHFVSCHLYANCLYIPKEILYLESCLNSCPNWSQARSSGYMGQLNVSNLSVSWFCLFQKLNTAYVGVWNLCTIRNEHIQKNFLKINLMSHTPLSTPIK